VPCGRSRSPLKRTMSNMLVSPIGACHQRDKAEVGGAFPVQTEFPRPPMRGIRRDGPDHPDRNGAPAAKWRFVASQKIAPARFGAELVLRGFTPPTLAWGRWRADRYLARSLGARANAEADRGWSRCPSDKTEGASARRSLTASIRRLKQCNRSLLLRCSACLCSQRKC
jgi:hypothetical protein